VEPPESVPVVLGGGVSDGGGVVDGGGDEPLPLVVDGSGGVVPGSLLPVLVAAGSLGGLLGSVVAF
jgi:hypothetical protein